MPDITTTLDAAIQLVVVGHIYPLDYPLSGCNLIGSHHHQHLLTGEDTVPGQDVQEGVLGEEGLGEVQKVRDDLVVAVCPEGGELKGVGCPLGLIPSSQFLFFQVVGSGGVGVVLGVGAIGDDKYLHILIQPRTSPETVPLVSVYLVEGFFELDTPPFEFHMHQGKSIDKDGDVIPGVMGSTSLDILVDDLDIVVVDVGLVNQVDVLALTCIPFEDLDIILLYLGCLGDNTIILVGNAGVEEQFPLIVCELVGVELLQLDPEVGN